MAMGNIRVLISCVAVNAQLRARQYHLHKLLNRTMYMAYIPCPPCLHRQCRCRCRCMVRAMARTGIPLRAHVPPSPPPPLSRVPLALAAHCRYITAQIASDHWSLIADRRGPSGRSPSAEGRVTRPRGRQPAKNINKSTDPPVHLLNLRPTYPPSDFFFRPFFLVRFWACFSARGVQKHH
jgi:hypothetical protein